eukprot:12411655-Karenia_brevis.AAC.1
MAFEDVRNTIRLEHACAAGEPKSCSVCAALLRAVCSFWSDETWGPIIAANTTWVAIASATTVECAKVMAPKETRAAQGATYSGYIEGHVCHGIRLGACVLQEESPMDNVCCYNPGGILRDATTGGADQHQGEGHQDFRFYGIWACCSPNTQ